MTTVQNNITLNAFREAFDSSSRTREQLLAFEAFCKVGLPTNKSEEYRFTPVGKFLEENFDLGLYGREVQTDSRPTNNPDEICINIINGKLAESIHSQGISVTLTD